MLTFSEITSFVAEFEALTLARTRWTHHGHLLVALWYLTHHPHDDALTILRKRIRAYNEAQGGVNSDREGYHETLTCFYLLGIAAHIEKHREIPLPESLAALLKSDLASKQWALNFYSKERLFSTSARLAWVEPDLVARRGLSLLSI